MGKFLNIISGLLIFLLVVPSIPIAISSWSIGGQYMNSTCADNLVSHNKSVMSLSTWLIINAIATVGYCIIGILLFFKIIKSCNSVNYYVFIGASSMILLFFKIIWNILGAILLFVRGETCYTEAKPLWDLTLAILIIQWLIFVISTLNIVGWCSTPWKV